MGGTCGRVHWLRLRGRGERDRWQGVIALNRRTGSRALDNVLELQRTSCLPASSSSSRGDSSCASAMQAVTMTTSFAIHSTENWAMARVALNFAISRSPLFSSCTEAPPRLGLRGASVLCSHSWTAAGALALGALTARGAVPPQLADMSSLRPPLRC